ncbi:MAG: ABC transporter permease subunit [Acidobacteria bacterium]|nr:ABC transporter permease subunit [Acidobacteriota bacterium]
MSRPSSSTPGLLTSSLRVFDLTIGEMLWSRRTIFMALVVGLPVIVAAAVRLLVEAGGSLPRLNRVVVDGPTIFGLIVWAFFVRFGVPVLAVFYGTSLIADEVEEKTLTYLFIRPIRREAVLLGKYLAYLVCTIAVVLPAVVLVWLLVVPLGGSLGGGIVDVLEDLGILAAGLAVYGALFALVGATVKRPLVVGLVFVFGWESIALALPGAFGRFTVAHYLQGLVPHAMPSDSLVSLLQVVVARPPSLTECLVWLATIAVVCLWLAARTVARREYVLEQ